MDSRPRSNDPLMMAKQTDMEDEVTVHDPTTFEVDPTRRPLAATTAVSLLPRIVRASEDKEPIRASHPKIPQKKVDELWRLVSATRWPGVFKALR